MPDTTINHPMWPRLIAPLVIVGAASALVQANAQTPSQYLSAADSDPIKMGWMQGFPPAKDKQLRFEDGSFFEFPAMRWSVVHMRDFMPTVNVSRGLGVASALPYQLDTNIDALKFRPLNAKQDMTWQDSLAQNYTDGIVVLHKGRVVYERYMGALTPDKLHAAMSVTKSFTGTLAAMLVAEGKLDDKKLVIDYIPDLKNSGYADATVRQVLDMTTALQLVKIMPTQKRKFGVIQAQVIPYQNLKTIRVLLAITKHCKPLKNQVSTARPLVIKLPMQTWPVG